MAFNGEQQPGLITPEVKHATDHVAELRRLTEVDQQTVALVRPRIYEIADTIAGQFVEPERHKVVEHTAKLIDWVVLGDHDGVAPAGLEILPNANLVDGVHIHRLTSPMKHFPQDLCGKFISHGLDEFLDNRRVDLEADAEAISETIKAIVRDSDFYRFVESFDLAEPQKKQDAELSPYWRQVRETQILRGIQDRHGLHETDIPPTSPHYAEWRRQLALLDLETSTDIKRGKKENTDGLRRLRTYMLGLLKDEYNRYGFESELASIAYDNEYNRHVLTSVDGAEQDVEYYDLAIDVEEMLSQAFMRPHDPANVFVYSFMANIMGIIFTDNFAGSIRGLLKTCVEDVDRGYTKSIIDTLCLGRQVPFDSTSSNILASLRPFDKHYADEVPLDDDFFSWESVSAAKSTKFNDGRRVLDSIRRPQGVVRRYGPSTYNQKARLVLNAKIYSPGKEAPSSSFSDLHMVLQPENAAILGKNVDIPGYKRVTVPGDSYIDYNYVIDPEGDPYADCEVAIPRDAASRLAEMYDSIGLQGLAHSITQAQNLTVEDLVHMIRQSSRYYLPEVETAPADIVDGLKSRIFPDLRAFGGIVSQDTLYTQCTQSAEFLAQSLKVIFGKSVASQITGMAVISKDDYRIADSGHAQTVFYYQGVQYILDATPSLPAEYAEGGDYRLPTQYEADAERGIPVKRQMNCQVETEIIDAKPVQIDVEYEINRKLEVFQEVVSNALQVGNDRFLAKYLMTLPPQDPARKTYELLRRVKVGKVRLDEVSAQGRYVIRCSEIDMKKRRQLGIDRYSSDFLQTLAQTVRSLSALQDA
jgi:hypothetical protein